MIRAKEDPRLVELALVVSDARPVDWERALAESPDLEPALTQLRILAQVAEQSEQPVEPAEPDPGKTLFEWGTLRALKQLGAGGFGEVFAAWDPKLERMVALKLRRSEGGADSSGTLQWLLEARRLASVRHPNVLNVYGADVHDGRAGIWTELIAGRTLEEALTVQGVFGAGEASIIGMDVCAALAAVHAAGLVHGDVKATNVMRAGASSTDTRASGRIVLMDFGSAREPGTDAAFGTPLGAAPELLRGDPASVASDLYAVGVLLYRLVARRYPFEADSLGELRDRVSRGERTPLRSARPDLPRGFVELVERALELDPARRFASAAEMEQALGAEIRSRTSRPAAKVMRRLVLVSAAIALLMTVGVVALRERATTSRTSESSNAAPPLLTAEPRVEPTRDPAEDSPTASPAPGASVSRPARGPLERVDVTLFLVNGDVREAVRSGDRIRPGDRLGLEVTSAEPIHVYVLGEDDHGSVVALYPLTAGDREALAPGASHRLPGRHDGEQLNWQVTSAGGRERILVLAGRQRLPSIEGVLATAEPPREGAVVEYPAVGERALLELRGITGIARDSIRPRLQESRLEALARHLGENRTPVWMRLFVLENPMR
ncbi:MAG: protein kinase [Candidatus Eisenbacteria bacterium]|uniref:Protein kinase n=1 Tax=Eiseniibacteriota bacterium TaxID=2212470 RepID=A0A849SQD5_UNCEI|nr:protein kinase [Candidatus Eisenbacteria bacterium]